MDNVFEIIAIISCILGFIGAFIYNIRNNDYALGQNIGRGIFFGFCFATPGVGLVVIFCIVVMVPIGMLLEYLDIH